ncbi:MAG: hypothetical protein ACM3N0_06460 [Chloroflexota bacterium]
MDTILGWRQDRRLVKAGARLVASDISVAEACLQNTKREGKWFAYYEFSTANWDEYRGVLAVKLDSNDFTKVSQCIVILRELFEKIPGSPGWPSGGAFMDLLPEIIKKMDVPLQEIAAARAVLRKWGGDAVSEREDS